MRFSITLGAAGPGRDPRSLAELAHVAEESGWDAIFLEDYIAYQGDTEIPTFDPWVCLAAMAMTTSSIRLGTTVTPVPRRRPWKLAAEAVSIDHLSNGRLILGVGLGDTGDPFMTGVGEQAEARVGGDLLVPGVRRRLARWDGCYAYKSGPITADDIREIRELVEHEQGSADSYDFRVGGGPNPTYAPGLAEAGATWFGRWIPAGDPATTMNIVRTGPSLT